MDNMAHGCVCFVSEDYHIKAFESTNAVLVVGKIDEA